MDARYTEWLGRVRKAKQRLAMYPCPFCKGEIAALVPPEGDVYDSLVHCPHCDRPHFKVVTADGAVTVSTGEESA